MTDKQVMQQALDALNRSSPNTTADYAWKPDGWVGHRLAAIAALETAIARPEQPAAPDDLDFVLPEVNSEWSHSNGDTYTVTGYADLHSDNHKRKPPRVIYQSAKTGRVWSREGADWHRAMTLAAIAKDATP